ncbi:hypothetical protein PR048_015394 [Dryococelus australis]|uniref:Glucose-methanol-choline oxidoreductase N-terminal domain-containing protein n=1 Tax=Dryococelus australis TaxID=614101 RepID=A0ABQ9HGZ8_9NEOP|nr:hypothetical protein PR048_015394 [Dryococelus australis]
MEATCGFRDTEFLSGVCGANYTTFMSLLSLVISSNPRISDPCRRLGRDGSEMPDISAFDYVLVRTGPAGSVIASCLEPSDTSVPVYFASAVGKEVDWKYKTQPNTNAFRSPKAIVSWPRGKMVGGTLAMEGMMYTRGHKNLYNKDAGNVDWGYDDLLPYFKKAESIRARDVEKKFHGTEGPVVVDHFPDQPKLSQSTSRVYLRTNKARMNPRVSINSHLIKVLINSATNIAFGVQFIDSKGATKTVLARREVILSAGAIGSPQLLLLSGVGPSEDLKAVGIDMKKDLPVEDDIPDIQVFFDGYSAKCARTGVAIEFSNGSLSPSCGRRPVDVRPTNVYPRSRGYLKLNSSNPLDYPLLYGNYLSDQRDVPVLIEGIKFILDMANTTVFAAWDIRLDTTPVAGCENLTFASDEYWECVIRTNTNGENHQVHGIARLRVVDASICPMVPNSNLTPFILAAAEKLASMIKRGKS